MNEKTRQRLAALNTAWQRYVKAIEQQLDTIPTEALNRDYLAAWEGLDDCGIAEWMLEYDAATFTFSLPDRGVYLLREGCIVDADSQPDP